MASQRTTQLICRHLQQLWSDGPGLTLDYVECWTTQQGQRLSRQCISRALNGRVARMRDTTALQLAKFIEYHTRGVISCEYLLDGRNDWLSTSCGGSAERPKAPPHPISPDGGVPEARQHPTPAEGKPAPAPEPAESWQLSIRTHLESLWQARRMSSPNPDLLLLLYQHLGDEYLWGAQENVIARAYYETAMQYALSSRSRALLLCRIAVLSLFTGQHSRIYLDDALSLAADDLEVRAWHNGVCALLAYSQDHDFDKTIQLARRALAEPTLARGLRNQVLRRMLKALGKARKVTDLDREADVLLGAESTAEHLAAAHQMLSAAYATAGYVHKALSHIQTGLELYSTAVADSESRRADLHLTAGTVYLDMGEADPARENLEQCLRLDAAGTGAALGLLCKSWIHDRAPRCQQWARRLVEHVISAIVATGTHNDYDMEDTITAAILWNSLSRIGSAERIMHHFGLGEHLHRRLETAAGSSVASQRVVLFAGEPRQKRALQSTLAFDDWTWCAGGSRARFEMESGRITIYSAPYRGIARMDMPRMMCVTGSRFAMQTRIHGAGQMVGDTLRCRQHARAGVIDGTALGSGGIIMALEKHVVIRISAHVLEPGEILCEMRQHRRPLLLGRGFLGEEPLFLRMEGQGDQVQLLAGLSADSMSLLGTVKVALSDDTATGIFAEAAMDLQSITGEAKTVFDQVRVEIG